MTASPRPSDPRDPGVLVLERCWDEGTCAAIRAAMDAGAQTPAEIFDRDYLVDESVRRTMDVDVEPAILERVEAAVAALRPTLSEYFGIALSGIEGAGFLRYAAGGFYRPHQDLLPHSEDVPGRRISIVLFLTGTLDEHAGSDAAACEGGALRVYTGGKDGLGRFVDIAPACGTLVAFPAHLVHEVLPVTRGIRDVIVDWFH